MMDWLFVYRFEGATLWQWFYSLLGIGLGAWAVLFMVYLVSGAWHAGKH
jgi:hypothetical protein